MQLQISDVTSNTLQGHAPLQPNINDKGTVFGGSSAALMTICGWALIKFNLEQRDQFNDVVIHRSQIDYQQAQTDDMRVLVRSDTHLDWSDLSAQIQSKNRPIKINLQAQVLNQAGEVCTQMQARYVVLKR